MRRCAFLTLADPTGFVIDDHLAYAPLQALGWQVEAVPWRQPGIAWGEYDLVVIRSPWDYQTAPAAFLECLGQIERAGAQLENSLELVRWNLQKSYLRTLERRGVPIVPTLWREGLRPGDLGALVADLQSPALILKPLVSANADGTYWLTPEEAVRRASEIEAFFADRPLLAQPFVASVLAEGEYSLFYFNGAHSHTIVKRPKAGDFRVQEEHGGEILSVEAPAPLLAAGARVMAALGEQPLYARVDLVRANERDEYWLMELELIEPALYLRMDPGAPERFARAIQARVA